MSRFIGANLYLQPVGSHFWSELSFYIRSEVRDLLGERAHTGYGFDVGDVSVIPGCEDRIGVFFEDNTFKPVFEGTHKTLLRVLFRVFCDF